MRGLGVMLLWSRQPHWDKNRISGYHNSSQGADSHHQTTAMGLLPETQNCGSRITGTFSPLPRISDPDMHHDRICTLVDDTSVDNISCTRAHQCYVVIVSDSLSSLRATKGEKSLIKHWIARSWNSCSTLLMRMIFKLSLGVQSLLYKKQWFS